MVIWEMCSVVIMLIYQCIFSTNKSFTHTQVVSEKKKKDTALFPTTLPNNNLYIKIH